MARTHLLSCVHEGCDYVARVVAGDLPARCPRCHQVGHWQIDRVYLWSLKDFRMLRALGISPD